MMGPSPTHWETHQRLPSCLTRQWPLLCEAGRQTLMGLSVSCNAFWSNESHELLILKWRTQSFHLLGSFLCLYGRVPTLDTLQAHRKTMTKNFRAPTQLYALFPSSDWRLASHWMESTNHTVFQLWLQNHWNLNRDHSLQLILLQNGRRRTLHQLFTPKYLPRLLPLAPTDWYLLVHGHLGTGRQ